MAADNDFYMQVLQKFGVDRQLDKLIEEMAELTLALQKYKYQRVHNVPEELADVDIVLSQIKLVFNEGDDSFDSWKNRKLFKLRVTVGD